MGSLAGTTSETTIFAPVAAADGGANLIFFRARTSIAGVEVPSIELQGQRVYPFAVPSELAKFARVTLEHLVVRGEVLTTEELVQVLLAEGVGKRSSRRKGALVDKPLTHPDLREMLGELTYRLRLPLSSRVPTGDGGSGWGLCRNRAQAEDYTASLTDQGRVADMKTTAKAVYERLDDWFAGWRPTSCGSWDRAILERAAEVLSARRLTHGELAKLLSFGDETQLHRWLAGGGSRIRDLVRDLRRAGVPVVAETAGGGYEGNGGYTLASSRAEAEEWLRSYKGRADQMEAHAASIERAARLWFPSTESERVEASKLTSAPQAIGSSPKAVARQQAKARRTDQDREKRELERQELHRRAEQREAILMPVYRVAQPIAENGGQATPEQLRAYREVKAIRAFLKTGKRPAAKLARENGFGDWVPGRSSKRQTARPKEAPAPSPAVEPAPFR